MTETTDFLNTERKRAAKSALWPLLVLAILVGAIAFFEPRVLTARAMSGFATDAAPLLLLVLGSAVVILIGGIDLSVATMASFASVTFTQINPVLGDWAVLVVLGLAVVIGCTQGFIHAWAQIPSFVVSLGTLGILYGVTHFTSNATAAPLSTPSATISFMASKFLGVPIGIWMVAVAACLLSAVFHFTRFGRDIYAVGASERAALMSGVDTRRVRVIAFGISGFCSALAGLLLLGQTFFSSPAMANNFILPAIVGVVVGGNAISGGVGGLMPALIGGLIAVAVRIGTVIVGLDPAYQNIAFGLVILIAVALTTDREKIGIVK